MDQDNTDWTNGFLSVLAEASQATRTHCVCHAWSSCAAFCYLTTLYLAICVARVILRLDVPDFPFANYIRFPLFLVAHSVGCQRFDSLTCPPFKHDQTLQPSLLPPPHPTSRRIPAGASSPFGPKIRLFPPSRARLGFAIHLHLYRTLGINLEPWALLRDSPRSLKIHPHRGSRLPSNIPLRTIQPRQDREPSSVHQHQHTSARPCSSAGPRPAAGLSRALSTDSESSWTDTGDIGDRYDDLDDPVRLQLPDEIEAELLAGVPKHRQRPDRGFKKVRIRSPSPDSRHRSLSSHFHIDKEAIRIPNPPPRLPTRAERFIGSIMAGRTGGIHGLTGKPLLYFTSIFVSLGVFLFGYDQGVMSGIITGPYFIDYFDHPSKAAVGTMVAILEIGALISSLIVGRLGDVIGRRKTILYGSCIFFVGGALQTLASTMAMMMLGRIIAGLGVGMLSTIVPVYQSEISPPHNRGKLACIEFSGNIIGYTTSVWVDYGCGFIKSNLSWRIPLLMQCVMGALLALGSLIIVESPRWLLDTDQDEEGMVVIANLYGGGDIHSSNARDEYKEIKMSVLLQRQEGERTYADMFQRYRTRVLIAMSAQALAQLNGINVISYYAPYVFESAGWVGHDAILMTGLNGITYFLSTIPPWYLVDRWGRRPILLSGAVMMAISLSLISYFIYLDVKRTPQMVVLFVMIYNAAFGYSWGPIPWLYPPEILPLSIRSKGASLSTATNWAFNWLVGEMTPILQEWIKWRLYLIHALSCVVSFVIVYFTYPETCGVRLEEMDSIFGDASTVHGAASVQDESASLMRAGSPVGSGLPNVAIAEDDDDRKSQMQTSGGDDRSVGAWLNRVVRGRSDSRGSRRSGRSGLSSQGRYTPLGQQDERARSGSGQRR
ncbi:General substrate transporter [Cordyceps fumosorosea ARSEF 2679]|uniref:General substrate transporter n=1 Tax=Cordyceps fumosorosea (strain ARSEF 2679) TaxID=1081104 RepID=A0A167VWF6_CORFA|nr:General substrate transporter [Cordyceps fumosorosea ARSEF 2679]OAA63054.1 General substrate transporter [Cordyceps fumosorosea ARSEF 2679]